MRLEARQRVQEGLHGRSGGKGVEQVEAVESQGHFCGLGMKARRAGISRMERVLKRPLLRVDEARNRAGLGNGTYNLRKILVPEQTATFIRAGSTAGLEDWLSTAYSTGLSLIPDALHINEGKHDAHG